MLCHCDRYIEQREPDPAYCYKIFKEMKRIKGGMLLLNYIALKALKRYQMPMARILMSG